MIRLWIGLIFTLWIVVGCYVEETPVVVQTDPAAVEAQQREQTARHLADVDLQKLSIQATATAQTQVNQSAEKAQRLAIEAAENAQRMSIDATATADAVTHNAIAGATATTIAINNKQAIALAQERSDALQAKAAAAEAQAGADIAESVEAGKTTRQGNLVLAIAGIALLVLIGGVIYLVIEYRKKKADHDSALERDRMNHDLQQAQIDLVKTAMQHGYTPQQVQPVLPSNWQKMQAEAASIGLKLIASGDTVFLCDLETGEVKTDGNGHAITRPLQLTAIKG